MRTMSKRCSRIVGVAVLLSAWGVLMHGTGSADARRLRLVPGDTARAEAAAVRAGQGDYLTGQWMCDGDRYDVRQDGADVWWLNESAGGRARVFSGRITGRQIFGKWADVRGSGRMAAGTLTLQVITPTRLRAATSRFCMDWTKK